MWQWNVTNIHDVIYPLNRRWVTLVNTLVLDTVLLPGLSGEVTPAARVSTTYNDSLFTWRNTLKHILVYCMMLIEMYIFKSCNNLFILQKKLKKNPKKTPMQLYTISWVLIHVHVVSINNINVYLCQFLFSFHFIIRIIYSWGVNLMVW